MPGSWQHFVPASYLATFSDHIATRRRESIVWVQRRHRPPFQTKAERIAARHDIYTLEQPSRFDTEIVDSVWGRIEGRIVPAIDDLVAWDGVTREVALDAHLWAEVLVPFAAQVFVRGPDFPVRQRHRMGERLYEYLSKWPNHHNHSRLMEYQRLLGVVAGADWRVLHLPKTHRLVSTDTARVPMRNSRSGSRGYIIPLRPDAALALRIDAASSGPKLLAQPDRNGVRWWMGPVVHEMLPENVATKATQTLAACAMHEIYGSSRHQVEELAPCLGEHPPHPDILEPYLIASHAQMRANALHYYRLLTYLRTPPGRDVARELPRVETMEIDFARIREVIPFFLTPVGTLSDKEIVTPVPDSFCVDVDPFEFPLEHRPITSV